MKNSRINVPVAQSVSGARLPQVRVNYPQAWDREKLHVLRLILYPLCPGLFGLQLDFEGTQSPILQSYETSPEALLMVYGYSSSPLSIDIILKVHGGSKIQLIGGVDGKSWYGYLGSRTLIEQKKANSRTYWGRDIARHIYNKNVSYSSIPAEQRIVEQDSDPTPLLNNKIQPISIDLRL